MHALRYSWTSPYAADAESDGGSYRLTIQAQPGMLPGPLRLTIHVPAGTRITAASPELSVSGTTATLKRRSIGIWVWGFGTHPDLNGAG